MASSSSSDGDRKHDVFLSFRGEDTRKIFVGHLYEALQRSMINAYIDSEDLDKGKRISELLIAIEDSRISIVVLSQDYASSKWCLRELAKIMECLDKKQQIVVPIFYDVDPSDVRKIKGTFAQAFAKHEADSDLVKEVLESWRSALTRFADLSGWDSRDYKDDAKLIKEVVEKTDKKLIRTSSHKASGGLVGMDFHITQMHSRLCLKVNDVRVVGIWGMGGLGKTTIAQAVYDEIACQFEHSCFVHNVKEALKNKSEVGVQKDIISQLLIKEVPSGGLNRSWNTIKGSLGRKRVLVVLDDVENFSQIEEVLGEPHAFGKASRIIVTTRDKQSPKKVDETYHPECLNKKTSHELLVKHAFGTDPPSEEYIDLLNQAVEYAQGLPLALKVLGASLYDKNIHEWKDVLEKIKIISDGKIMDVLRISFEGLDFSERQIFLDIACLFRGRPQNFVTEILHGLHPHSGLKNLVNRSLVTIDEDGELDMHDLLQEMGRDIVRREYLGGPLKEPGQLSRLWSFKDVDQVLTQNTATDAIECLALELPSKYKDYPYCINVGAFARMTKLRVLIIGRDYDDYYYYFNFNTAEQVPRGELEILSYELRLLQWEGCPLQSLPNTFIPKNLVILDMSSSHIQQLWEGTMPLQNLKEIRLIACRSLVKIPDLTEAIHLKKLYLNYCSSLLELHSSISALPELECLTLTKCEQLEILPSSLNMKSLETLVLSECSNLEKFPEISDVMSELQELHLDRTAIKELPELINNLTGLRVLDLSDCEELTTLPSSIHLSSLRTLDLSGCSNLEKFPEISDVMSELPKLDLSCTAIKELPESINNLTGLRVLKLSYCRKLTTLSSTIHLSSLRTLDLSGCSNLEKFPEISDVMSELPELDLSWTAIKELPESINNLTGLRVLKLSYCRKLTTLSSTIHLSSLRTLDLSGCSNLEKFPEISDVMSEIPELDLSWTAIKELHESINNLTGLRVLKLSNCQKLTTLPSSIHLSSLRTLDLSGCSNLEKFPKISGTMKNLYELYLDDTAVKGLLSSIHLLEGLKTLTMQNCKSLECLPDSICNLAQLTHLDLSGCSALQYLPELSSIKFLNAHCCTALETVSIPKIDCIDFDFRFSNCHRLVQTTLFTNIETRFLDQDFHPRPLSCYMCFPGSEIPNWFSHQSRASSLTVQLPPNWFDNLFLGFAICFVTPDFPPPGAALCYCTFKGNQGELDFIFHLQGSDFTSNRSLESDHLFMTCLSWSKFRLAEKSEPVNERYFTEATFRIVVESTCNFRSKRHCMTRYGVRFFHGSYMDGQNESMTNTTIHVEGLEAPFFPDQLEMRKSVTEWEAESTEMATERGTYQILELFPEPQTERNEEEVMVAAAQVDVHRVLRSVCCCLSLSGCSCIMS